MASCEFDRLFKTTVRHINERIFLLGLHFIQEMSQGLQILE